MFKPKRALGQNFLIDKNIAANIVKSAEIEKDEEVWEIGPGKGILTEELIKAGSRLTCFEIDRDLIPWLKDRFNDSINLIPQDVLKANWAEILSNIERLKNERSQIVLVANIPYNITSPLLYKLSDYADYFRIIVLMLQKEVADRLTASAGSKSYGVLTLKVQYNFKVKKLFKVPRHLFRPQPKVDSEVIRLIKREDKEDIRNPDLFWQIVETAFHLRRKTLKNNLSAILSKQELQFLTEIFEANDNQEGKQNKETKSHHKYNLSRRGESLDEKDFVDLYHHINNIRSHQS
ncbi:MAG: 16S rRNA (adenine(1518)-N(6)/adenine(1519)-N(6))-dimethyltransferase RsmA [Candidatus Cloacimonetes bacterium]|nr:16S rRNA (adenine(1518)-N(6)/adenine(1519)-N(6))-dimethyltransferase RsmA [Candidatus Cloacimonadota bacterium]